MPHPFGPGPDPLDEEWFAHEEDLDEMDEDETLEALREQWGDELYHSREDREATG